MKAAQGYLADLQIRRLGVPSVGDFLQEESDDPVYVRVC